jgi:hypothetical protein
MHLTTSSSTPLGLASPLPTCCSVVEIFEKQRMTTNVETAGIHLLHAAWSPNPMSKSVTGHEKEESESHEIEYTRTTRATHMARIITS